MPLDLNELSAFVSTTDNKLYLIDLFNHIGQRLSDMGVPTVPIQNAPLGVPAPAAPEPAPIDVTDLFAVPVAPVDLHAAKEPLEAKEQVKAKTVVYADEDDEGRPVREELTMPDYSPFPDGLRQKLEAAWEERRQRVTA